MTNATQRFSEMACVHDLVRRSAQHTPDRVAVEDGAVTLTYAELDALSDQLAAYLLTLGATVEALVGIHLTRTVDLVVSLLGVLKAGCAYVPLDPNFPPDRLAMMIEDSQLQLMISEATLRGRLSLNEAIKVVEIDSDRAAVAAAQPHELPVIASTSLMYVIYTSGSTGRPKGVELEHRSVVNFLESMQREPGLNSNDRLLAITTLSFDIAMLELFLPLIVGGTVVITPNAAVTDPFALAQLIANRSITVMQATPSTWRMLLESHSTGAPHLKALCGGEALPAPLAEQLLTKVGELWNMYGPTETTIWSTLQRLGFDEPVTIGHPIANTTVYLLDESGARVADGEIGELHIGGDGLARGYRNMTDMTMQRFVADPYSNTPNARMYRTGDLARINSDANLEYLGRIDQQVKIRGFRIELGEIEVALSRHPGVEETVVLAKTDPQGEPRLVAYVARRAGATCNATGLRQSVQDTLPKYMVPSLVEFVTAMPRTPNGKTDRNGFADPDWTNVERSIPFVAPRDELEQRMTDLWQHELGLAQIGVDDDLFELGVESIVAARLIASIETAFHLQLPLGVVFEHPTPAGIATLVRDRVDTKMRWPSLVPIQPTGSKPPWFGIHGGAGTVLLLSELARRLRAHDQPFYGLQAQGLYGHDPIHTRIPEMAAAYIPQIREVQPHGPYVFVGYCFGAFVAYEIAQQLTASGETVQLVCSINGPSLPYIHRYDPDNLLGLDDEAAERAASSTAAMSRKARLRHAIRKPLRDLQLEYVIRMRKPMPEVLRENNRFQRIAMKSQFHYQERPYGGTIAVFRANGLYAEPELGWRETSGHDVRCYEVPGEQPVPRSTMKEPTVGFIANELVTLLHELTLVDDD